MPPELAFLLGAEVGEPVVVHDPGIDVRLVDAGDGHPLAEVEIAQLHQRRLFAADDDLAVGVADGEEALHGLPVGRRAGDLVFARRDEAALAFVEQLAVRRSGTAARHRPPRAWAPAVCGWRSAARRASRCRRNGSRPGRRWLVAQPSRSAVRRRLCQIGPPAPGLILTLRSDGALEDFGLHLAVVPAWFHRRTGRGPTRRRGPPVPRRSPCPPGFGWRLARDPGELVEGVFEGRGVRGRALPWARFASSVSMRSILQPSGGTSLHPQRPVGALGAPFHVLGQHRLRAVQDAELAVRPGESRGQ